MIKPTLHPRAVLRAGKVGGRPRAWHRAGAQQTAAIFLVVVAVLQQEAEVVAVGQPASSRNAIPLSFTGGPKDRHSTQTQGGRQWARRSRCAPQTISVSPARTEEGFPSKKMLILSFGSCKWCWDNDVESCHWFCLSIARGTTLQLAASPSPGASQDLGEAQSPTAGLLRGHSF